MMLAAFPDTSLRFFAARSRRWVERHARALGLDELARSIARQTNGKVASGPFEGMALDYDALPVNSASKFLGTYEREIIPFVEDAISLNPPCVLNVGASDGYYAVGLARRLRAAKVYFAEADRKSVLATLLNAKRNAVEERVASINIIHSGEFSKYIRAPGSLIFMDCEGAEFNLLRPELDPILKETHIIVEIHEQAGSADELVRRFSETHLSQMVRDAPRRPSDLPATFVGRIPPAAMNEYRGPQTWIYFKAKAKFA